jgi:ACT domain-containing protein
MKAIRRLLVEGRSNGEIQQMLGLPPRTYYRYRNAVFEHDRKVMNQHVTDTEVMNQMIILNDRLNEMYQDLGEISKDKSVDGMARVKAVSLRAEMAVSVIKIHKEVPAMLAAEKEIIPPSPYANKKNVKELI